MTSKVIKELFREFADLSSEEQADFWKNIINSRKGRKGLIIAGITQKEIEKMYLDYNNIKVINIPILNESWQLKI